MANWKLRDVIVMVVLAVVVGALYRVWDVVYNFIPTVSVAGQAAMNGLWMIASVLVMYIIRRPGAALVAELIAAYVEFIFGGQWGLSNLSAGLIQGIGAELIFLFVFYRRYNLAVCMLSGALAGFASVVQWYFQYGGMGRPAMTILLYLIISLVSGAILGGWLPRSIGNALNRAGVVRNFAIAHETRAMSK